MDYITAGILDDINFLRRRNSPNIYSTLAQYYRILFEYHINLMFACLWDRKEHSISINARKQIIDKMFKPQLGKTVDCIFDLNEAGDPIFDLSAKYEKNLRDFINYRNTYFGHGIIVPQVQETIYKDLYEKLEKLYRRLADFEQEFFGDDCEFHLRSDPEDMAQIIVFQPHQRPLYRDIEKKIAQDYQQNALYFSCKEGTFKVSPFLLAVEHNGVSYDFYLFAQYKIQSGKFDYHLISEIGKLDYSRVSEIDDSYKYSKTFPDFFTGYRQVSKYTIIRGNGVVSNNFKNNYDYFIDIAPFTKYVTQIWDFLLKNQSNTCLTIRGGGGIGKTALVQYICTKNLFDKLTENPEFNYVIFCSAKDREFYLNTMTQRGQIRSIDEEKVIDSYRKILLTACRVLEIDLKPDSEENIAKIEDAFLKESGVLLIIDDFETLPDTEKEKVVNLIKRMNINRHKVLITTRSQYMIGSIYNVERMNEEQVISFMKKRFETITNPNSDVDQQFKDLLARNGMKKKIYSVTMGLPLLAIQLATLLPLKGFAEKLLSKRFTDDAEDFLLGRLYSYFGTPTLKLLFLLIAFFVKYDLHNAPLLELKIFYELHCRRFNILNVDFDNDLQELERWNIIKIEDDFIPVNNQISHKVFDKCVDEFLVEYSVDNLFDERLFKLVAQDSLNKGVLKYIALPDAFIDEPLIDILAFENVSGKFTNAERCLIIKALIDRCENDNEKIRDLRLRGEKYFDSYEEFFLLFDENNIRPNHETKPLSSDKFQNINQKLENILIKSDEIFGSGQRLTRAFMEENIYPLIKELKQICTTDLQDALDDFSPENVSSAQKTEQLMRKISKRNFLKCTNYENFQKLSERLEDYSCQDDS